MLVSYPFAVSVQWIHRTINAGGSAYSGSKLTEAAPVATTGVFAPGGSAEITLGGDVVTTQPTLYGIDPSLGVAAVDVFVIGGVRYEVDGDPQSGWQSPFTGWSPGQVVHLRKVTG
jgi:hypothetical protein